MTTIPALDRLRSTLDEGLPYCSGTYELPVDIFDLYYGRDHPKFVNLSKMLAKPEALAELQATCEPAMFGRNDKTILDETYRKAGKMDTSQFALHFNAQCDGLLDVVRSSLLLGEQSRRSITAQLYKLNVYGEGAFFKPHQDTPLSDKMFGSLVVVFPTEHSGGALVLRHHGKEWTFDSGEILANAPNSIGYAAFFSDVEHEVTPVLSGHRVTITYNLFWADTDVAPVSTIPRAVNVLQPQNASTTSIESALKAVLSDQAFLPAGGTLGFGLRHTYPFPRTWDWRASEKYSESDKKTKDILEVVTGCLKGTDAALFAAFEALGLQPKLRFVSDPCDDDTDPKILLDHLADLGSEEVGGVMSRLIKRERGIAIDNVDADSPDAAKMGETRYGSETVLPVGTRPRSLTST
ncbi:hypothetical protein C8Q74DRAFT_1223153 [Fomes fomentarius]|nr:hypothetical protein C8Q74DRAFT_1223153 [Fomes fomentarius]